MGTNRNVIHPKFGNFILLETILVDVEIDAYDQPLDYNPCLGCNLCIAACPVGAISNVRDFDFFACLGHNYREFPFSAADWVDAVAEGDASAYRAKFREGETLTILQSLTFEPSYRSAYCMAVCPAGEDVIGPYLADKKEYRDKVLIPLRERPEPVYVQSGSHAEKTASRNPASRCATWISSPASPPWRTSRSGCGTCSSGVTASLTGWLSSSPPARSSPRCATDGSAPLTRMANLSTPPCGAESADYVALLQRAIPGRPGGPVPYAIDGDADVVDRLLATLD